MALGVALVTQGHHPSRADSSCQGDSLGGVGRSKLLCCPRAWSGVKRVLWRFVLVIEEEAD